MEPQKNQTPIEKTVFSTLCNLASFVIVEMWMDLKSVILSDVRKRETITAYRLICGIQKNGTEESICKTGIEMQMYKTDLWTQWGGWDRLRD